MLDLAEAGTAREKAFVAKVQGNYISELPQDLYIPPDALEVVLEMFEGPLDLLLYLIRKHNLDILNIPVAEITKQYVRYIEIMRNFRLELAAEYLEMAALLTEIKSRMLLPRNPENQVLEEELDPRIELVRRLQEYEQFKKAAENLDAIPRLERDVFLPSIGLPALDLLRPQPVVRLEEIVHLFQQIMQRADLRTVHTIQREVLTVREKMASILAGLQEADFVEFKTFLVPEEGRMGIVVTFLSTLELVKECLVELVQNEAFGPIYIRMLTC
ncbi:MAG: segregation and condensation protein A [Gammaproteobacteria bacterium]